MTASQWSSLRDERRFRFHKSLFAAAVAALPATAFGQVEKWIGTTADCGSFLIRWGSTSSYGADRIVITDFQPAPEPSLLALPLILPLFFIRRRRRGLHCTM